MSLLWVQAAQGLTVSHEDHGTYGRLFAHHPAEDEPVGMVAFTRPGDGTLGIDNILTRPAYARQGVASGLLDTLRAMHPGHRLVTSDLSPSGKMFNESYRARTGHGMTATSPGAWYKTAAKEKMSWDEVQAKHPTYDVRPESHPNEHGEYGGPNEDHGWAINELAHGDGEGSEENHSEHELDFTHETIHPDDINHEHHPVDDPRVARALRGYRNHQPVPPVLLVKRAGEYHVADGHHRVSAASMLNLHIPAIVAHSPRTDPLVY